MAKQKFKVRVQKNVQKGTRTERVNVSDTFEATSFGEACKLAADDILGKTAADGEATFTVSAIEEPVREEA